MIPLTVPELMRLALQSLRQPKVVMSQILRFDLTRKNLVLLTFLLIVVDLMSGLVLEILFPGMLAGGAGLRRGVAPFFVLQMFTIFGGTLLIHSGGRLFGGVGRFDDCLKMVLWLNFVFFLLHFALPLSAVVMPHMQGMVFLVIAAISFVQMVAYVMVVHRFERVVSVVFGVLAAQFIFGIFLLILSGMLGLNIGVEPV